VLYKSLEVPKPNPETAAAGATQGKNQTINDLKNDYILVEIDSNGAMKIDREPVAAEMSALVERLRAAREATGRKAMLLSADALTPHRNAVLAYDAANEIGLGIAIARPAPKGNR
jgi:biopolymer transport protein ExbD